MLRYLWLYIEERVEKWRMHSNISYKQLIFGWTCSNLIHYQNNLTFNNVFSRNFLKYNIQLYLWAIDLRTISRCSPESIAKRKFTTKGDIWSYGILMWEVFTHAKPPVLCSNFSKEGFQKLMEGKRLKRPTHCPELVYQFMEKCWKFKPEERPDFNEACQSCRYKFKDIKLSMCHWVRGCVEIK